MVTQHRGTEVRAGAGGAHLILMRYYVNRGVWYVSIGFNIDPIGKLTPIL